MKVLTVATPDSIPKNYTGFISTDEGYRSGITWFCLKGRIVHIYDTDDCADARGTIFCYCWGDVNPHDYYSISQYFSKWYKKCSHDETAAKILMSEMLGKQ